MSGGSSNPSFFSIIFAWQNGGRNEAVWHGPPDGGSSIHLSANVHRIPYVPSSIRSKGLVDLRHHFRTSRFAQDESNLLLLTSASDNIDRLVFNTPSCGAIPAPIGSPFHIRHIF